MERRTVDQRRVVIVAQREGKLALESGRRGRLYLGPILFKCVGNAGTKKRDLILNGSGTKETTDDLKIEKRQLTIPGKRANIRSAPRMFAFWELKGDNI